MNKGKLLGRCLSGAILVFLAVPWAYADAIDTKRHVSEIVAQQKEIQADAKQGKRGWDAIPMDKRSELLSRQEELFTLLSGKETIGDLSDRDQVKVANTLEWINALATNADDERRICQREPKTGSHRITTVCRSAGSIRTERQLVKDEILRRPPSGPRRKIAPL